MNTNAPHSREDEAAAYVFGQMDAAERITFVKAMNQDVSLQALVDDLNFTASALALDGPQAVAPAMVRERLLASVATITQDGAQRPSQGVAANPQRRTAALGWAAAAGFAIVSGVLWNDLRGIRDTNKIVMMKATEAEARATTLEKRVDEVIARDEALSNKLIQSTAANATLQQSVATAIAANETLQKELTQRAKIADDLKVELVQRSKIADGLKVELAKLTKANDSAKMQIAMLQSTVKEYKQGVAVVVWNSETQEGILKLEKMPPVETGKDYQLWVVDPSKKTPVNAGVVRVDEKGFAKVDFKPTLDIQQADKFALSVEKVGGVAENEGPIILLSP